MANKTLFQTLRGALIPVTTTVNDAGAPAYELSPKAALARLAATGCLTRTYYASAGSQLDLVLDLANKVDVDFLAQTALYARRKGFMKDMPALLCAVLATRDLDRLIEIFPQVIDNGKMLRNFVQILRSGVTGRKSLGSAPKRLVRKWLERATERQLIQATVGNDPSLADVVKMVHPRPSDSTREAFYAWLVGKPWDEAALPETLRAFEAWKTSREGEVPDVPFQMLTAQDLGEKEWTSIASNASWQTTRMNLNTFARHGVLRDEEMVKRLAARLADPDQVRRARVFPYQLLIAFMNAGAEVPWVLKNALQDAMETAIGNVPKIEGKVVICPDVSGSMQSPVTGYRQGGSTKVRCIDVAALVAAAFLRKNREARVLPFEVKVVKVPLNPRDSVMTNATALAKIGGGGTNCSAPLALLNQEKAVPDLVIFVSDNESWADPKAGRGTSMMAEWEKIKNRNPKAKLVCIDIVPNTTTQAPDRKDILNIAGFSDSVFDLIASFAAGAEGAHHWIKEIELQPLAKHMKTA
ncbi:TROVE domain-containing protein [Luteolibacter yonseiensis]|uniref:TROVE domain-containing protein n=1 Tax=Luteolibacter yonseiensis TaxID=1144680 RepID=A0A934R5D6_9BACT|nr:TROVE domain-containing protein [Luteolibacter yonseiensis]MBK1815479.1 TROVE domain-containing protein [Luteolibacter yonseiensis]